VKRYIGRRKPEIKKTNIRIFNNKIQINTKKCEPLEGCAGVPINSD
jgi:hypothetical protein